MCIPLGRGLLPGADLQQPKTSYVRNGEVNIAYQVLGEGAPDLVLVPGFVSHLDLGWSNPEWTGFLRRLASFSRLILFDKRGTGLSDPVSGVPTLEDRMEDLHAVLDAAGSERTALLGISEGGPMSVLFAATYPQRTISLVLYGSSPRFSSSDSFLPEKRGFFERVRRETRSLAKHWGEGRSLELFAPTIAGEEAVRRAYALFERASVSPAMVEGVFRFWWEVDVADVLPIVGVPTLVVHRSGDRVLAVEAGRYMAERIPGARFVELAGDDHFPHVGDANSLLDEIEEFLTGARHSGEAGRVLATVLFTDIVASTQRAAQLGDRRWHELLEAHDLSVRRRVDSHGGRVVKSLGDGYLITFDGPARAIRCAREVVDDAVPLGLAVRSGVHTGECELMGDDVVGMAVNIGARVSETAGPGEVLVSSAVRDLVVGSGIEFDERGAHALKGVPGSWTLLAVKDTRGARTAPSSTTRKEPDRLAPNLERAHPGDRVALRIARNAPSVARLVARLTTRRARPHAQE
jgi:pimeloyl-ACP methyl ester carboxylesterase